MVLSASRLELARLLFADFEPSVVGIVAQPFLLQTEVKAKQRRHIPDYLFVTNQGPVVVDVKPQRRLADSTDCVYLRMDQGRRAVARMGL